MMTPLYVVCRACGSALALEWDTVCFAAEDPLAGQALTDFEAVEAAIVLGLWPTGEAPCPLAAGAWAALAARALPFFRQHAGHPGGPDVFITPQAPENITPLPPPPFVFPKALPATDALPFPKPGSTRNLSLTERQQIVLALGETRLWENLEKDMEQNVDALLLTAWLPPDKQTDKRLLDMLMDFHTGPLAEEALATRLVLGNHDIELRRNWLLESGVRAYSRRALFTGRPRPTPYDRMAPLDLIQAAAVKRMSAAGFVDPACELAIYCKIPAARMDLLRQAVSERILDVSRSTDERLRLAGYARTIFPGLIKELRHERGLAEQPLPSPEECAALDGSSRTLAGLTCAPACVRAALQSMDVAEVITALEVIQSLALIAPEDAAEFASDVLPLCRDPRTEPPPIRTRLCARARNVHAELFAVPGTGTWEALIEVIEAMLAAGLGVSLDGHFRSLSANNLAVERVGDWLCNRVADRSRPAKERLQAREALAKLATDAAATARNQPHPSPEGHAAARRADDFLIAALSNPTEPEEFIAAIRSSLTRWMPERLPELRGNVVEYASVPSIATLVRGQSIAGIDQDEVLALLQDGNADIGRVLGAIALVEQFVRMTPKLAVRFEPLLRERMADTRRFADQGRNLIVALEAWFAHHAIWSQLKPEERPAAATLLASLRRIAQAHEEPGAGERSYAGMLAETLRGYLEAADENLIGDGLEQLLADRAARPWSRLHAYFAMTLLRDQGVRAEKALFAALADPGEDALLRREAHPLLAFRFAQQLYELQKGGVLPRPVIPPIETLYHNLPMYERDTDGEWLLTPAALRLASQVYPDDVVAALDGAAADPSRTCAAAALAPLVGQRLPAVVGQFARPLRSHLDSQVEVNAVIDGRAKQFRLADLCAEALRLLNL